MKKSDDEVTEENISPEIERNPAILYGQRHG